MTASASISTRHRGSRRPATTTMVPAGRDRRRRSRRGPRRRAPASAAARNTGGCGRRPRTSAELGEGLESDLHAAAGLRGDVGIEASRRATPGHPGDCDPVADADRPAEADGRLEGEPEAACVLRHGARVGRRGWHHAGHDGGHDVLDGSAAPATGAATASCCTFHRQLKVRLAPPEDRERPGRLRGRPDRGPARPDPR